MTLSSDHRIAGRMPVICGAAVIALLLVLGPSLSAADEQPLPETLLPVFDYLLELNASPDEHAIHARQLAPMIDFILKPKPAGSRFASSGHRLLDPLVYHEYELPQSLATILSYAHHPAIPSHVFALSSLRHAYWKEIDGQPQAFPDALAERLARLDAPLVVHGIEHEEITPDLTSGAYYSYDLDRTLALFQVEGKTIWISLARQRNRSDVGRKGYVLGPDEAWNYLYTGEEGIRMAGLGWVDSYMYDAFSAIVYIQETEDAQKVRCGVFKWLRAGWNNLNFVKPEHIRLGLERYADTFQVILQAPGLPSPEAVAAAAESIGALHREALEGRVRDQLRALEESHGEKGDFPHEWYREAVEEGDYLARLSRPQLEAGLFLAYMKQALKRRPAQASLKGSLP